MGNKYIYPTEKFNVKLDLEVDVKYVGVWDGMGTLACVLKVIKEN